MINQGESYVSGSARKASREFVIIAAGLHSAARVVVRDRDPGNPRGERRPEEEPSIDTHVTDGAEGDLYDPDNMKGGVQVDDQERFLGSIGEMFPHEVGDVFRCGDLRRWTLPSAAGSLQAKALNWKLALPACWHLLGHPSERAAHFRRLRRRAHGFSADQPSAAKL